MKKEYFRYGLLFVLIVCLFAFPISCGPGGGGGDGEEEVAEEAAEEEAAEEEEVVEPVASIAHHFDSLTVNPTTIRVEATATVTADVRDSDNDPVPDGTTVLFSVENSTFGSITASSTTNAGFATVTFTAANSPGDARINARSGDATASVDITIEQAPAAAIEYISAEPNVIALEGTGGVEISTVRFMVVDSNDNPLEGINVTFAMVGPGGGEYINPDSGSSASNGVATVRLYSGSVAGPVTISATALVGDPPTPMTVQTTGVSIGGGVPSDKRFSVAATKLNLPGLVWNGKETEVTAWLADRFGSYNILQGTSVSFGTEVGITTDTADVTLQDDGRATVTVRTQAGAGGAHAEDVLPEPWEEDLQTYLADTYGYTTTAHPRDGLCSVFVYTNGEEQFDDLNANGVYDFGTDLFLPAYDTAEDPFYDYDDDEQYNDGATYPVTGPPYNPAEIFIDSAPANGTWDGPDGVWSDDTYIFRNFKILVTGRPLFFSSVDSFHVLDGLGQDISFIICDRNLNQLVSPSLVRISASIGNLTGRTEWDFSDSNQVGPDLANHLYLIEFPVRLTDDKPAVGPEYGQITVTITWAPEGEAEEHWIYRIDGVID